MTTTTIICVLRSGGDFKVEHVERLRKLVAKHIPAGVHWVWHPMFDTPTGYAVGEFLTKPWPKFWAKIEVFRRRGPSLYFDLDTTPMGDLSPLLAAAKEHELVVCRDFLHPEVHVVNTSIMAWSDDLSGLYRRFERAPEQYMRQYKSLANWGDQAFVRDWAKIPFTFWDDILPEGSILSYKRDVLSKRVTDLSKALVTCHHGHPRPWASGF
jgi:hypothetical protein